MYNYFNILYEGEKIMEKNNNHTIEFLIGLILLSSGLFILAQKVTVSSGWYMFHLGVFSISSGLVTIPLILSFIWYIVKPTKKASKICLIISAVLLVLSIIMNTRFYFSSATLFDYIVIFGLISLGIGLMIKEHTK